MTFQTSWKDAERHIFATACTALGSSENASAFLGYMPLGAVDVWMFTTGNPGLGDYSRQLGPDHEYADLTTEAIAACQFASREKAMEWAMRWLEMLKDQHHFRGQKNIFALYVATNHPSQPEPVESGGDEMFWSVSIPMQLIYKTTVD